MLTALSLEHFKSWKQIRAMRLAPITGLFGSNSSGKTSILQLLLMLKQTVESSDRAQVLNFGDKRDERSLVVLGTFWNVIHKHETPNTLRWIFSWTLPQELRVDNPEQENAILFSGNDMQFHAEVAENGAGRVIAKKLAYRFAGYDFTMTRKSETEEKYQLSAEAGDFRFKRIQGRPWDLPAPVKCYGFPDQVRTYHQNAGFLADFERAFEDLSSQIHYLGPLREYPEREYTWAGAQPTDVGRRGEKAIDALLASRARGEKISRGQGKRRLTVEEYVAWWLQELGLIHSFSVRPLVKGSNIYQVWVRKSQDAPEVLLTEIGFGVSQILPVLVLCYYVPEGSILILEQPEIHLHPSVQTGLADVFIDAIKTRKVQILVESHSEHLLRRLQRRIAEEKLAKDDAALYFCDIADGASRLTPLELDIFGNITNWPKDFFGDEFGEIAAATQAVIERKKRQET
jgi:predicted ATPase